MIVEWLLAAVEAALVWIANLFPRWEGGDPFSGLASAIAHMGDLNYYLPIAEVFTFVLGAFVVFPALAGVSLLVWILAFLRGGSARA